MTTDSGIRNIQLIGCGVLAVDLKHIAQALGIQVRMQFLPGGLHREPNRLRVSLQEAIDTASADPCLDRLVIAYGLCGRGTVDLHARNIPLAIPRVHDCIALFLGSDARYREQFSREPGTYYLSAGWVEEQGGDGPGVRMGSDGAADADSSRYAGLLRQYGRENADYVTAFLDSWKRNYTRSVFIDTGAGSANTRYERAARHLAQSCGWRFERLDGTHDLLVDLLTAAATTDDILIVPPGGITRYDAVRRRLAVAPEQRSTPDASGPVDPGGNGAKPALRTGLGLGIDAGGTYTDAVLHDFGANRILESAKALTTPYDYSAGVAAALRELDPVRLREVRLVCVSTTLATNALVEQRGQQVGLLVMPPYGHWDAAVFQHRPIAFLDGQLDIDGQEIEPVDLERAVATARQLVQRDGVAAFAVSGFAGHINPAHELAVKQAVAQATGLSVTCGHDLSDRLDYRVRAETAALNARIIPCLKTLLEHLHPVLDGYGVKGTVMVVRSDGSLMSLAAALERPIETMLSGPAASVAGAAWLAREPRALVVDVGGTTTDAAFVRDGAARMLDEGAVVGRWRTHIRALDLRTCGLGGDSEIRPGPAGPLIGPRRVHPVSWASTRHPGFSAALDWLRRETVDSLPDVAELAVMALDHVPDDLSAFAPDEVRLINLLAERPRSLGELRLLMNRLHSQFLPLAGLEAQRLVMRCGLTPTDALHTLERIALWDRGAADVMTQIVARLAGMPAEAFALCIVKTFERRLATEILCKRLGESIDLKDLESQPIAQALIALGLDVEGERETGCRLRFELDVPVIGIGAPAECFVPAAAALLNTRCLVPGHAGVANAVGAVTAAVTLHRRVNIVPDDQGRFRISGMPGSPLFASIDEATRIGRAFLESELKTLAQSAGAAETDLVIRADDAAAPSADGSAVFISRLLEGRISGPPALS